MTEDWAQAQGVRSLLALPAVAPAASGGLPTFGTGTGQLNVTGGRADADVLYLKGYALTEAAGAGKLAAALSYFLDVATPLLTAAVGSAAIADAIWDEVLSGHSGAGAAGTALETLTTLGARTNNKTLNALLGIPDTAAHTALTDLADALWDEVLSGHAGAGAAGTALETLTTLGARTNNKTLNALLGIPDTAAHTLLTDGADAVWDEVLSGHTGAGSAGKATGGLSALAARTNNGDLNALLGVADEAAATLLTKIAAGAVASIAGDVGGKVLGGGSGTITGTGTQATVAALTADGITAVASAVWNAVTSGMTTVGSIGKKLADWTILTSQAIRDAMKLAPTSGSPATGSIDKQIDDIETDGVNIYNTVNDLAINGVEILTFGTTAKQQVRDTLKLAPTAGDPEAGSVDKHLDDILEDTATIPASPAAVGSAMTLAADAIADAQLAADTDVYEARVSLFVDGANAEDSYAVGFFKNGAPVLSGITVPAMTVYQMNAAGTVLLNAVTLLQASTLGLYYYDTATLSTAGVAYQAKITATIDGSSRTMTCPVGRDSSA